MASEMTEMGESLEHVDSLIEELNKFHSLCQVICWFFLLKYTVLFLPKNFIFHIYFCRLRLTEAKN